MDLLRQHYNFQGQSKAPMEQQDEGGEIFHMVWIPQSHTQQPT